VAEIKGAQLKLFEEADQYLKAGDFGKAAALFRQLCEQFPNRPRGYIGHARSLADQDPREQLQAWQRALQKFPQSEAVQVGLVRCLVGMGAEGHAELLRLRNDGVLLDEVENGLGHIALAQGRPADAAAHLQRALRIKPERPWTRLKLVETLLKLKRHEEAVTEGMAALEEPPVTKLPPFAPLVASALSCSRTREARTLLLAFLERVPDALATAMPVLRTFVRNGATELLLQTLEAWQQERTHDPEAGWLMVRALRAAGFDRTASERCAQLRDAYPEREDFGLETARLLTTILDWPQAYAAWNLVRAQQPLLPEAVARAAHTLLRTGEAQRSVDEMASLLRCHRDDPQRLLAALFYARRLRRLNSIKLLNARLLACEEEVLEQASLMLEQQELNHRLGLPVGDLEPIRQRMVTSKPNSALRKRFDELQYRMELTTAQEDAPALAALPEPVDVVYTWVDGRDPVWLEKFQRYSGIDPWAHQDDSQNWRRYEHFEEIYLSLQTLDRYFPEARNIFIVTDQQRFDLSPLPETVQRKIRFVFHSEIIPADEVALPTFVSDVIEAFLDRIPDLSETFLYFNDDVFLGRPLRASDLFDAEGRPVATVVKHDWPTDREVWKRQCDSVLTDSHVARIPVTLECFERRLGTVPAYTDNHQFRVRTRTQYRRMMEIFGQDLKDSLFHSRLREKNSVRTCMLLDWIAGHENTHALRFDDRTVRTGWLGMQELDWEHVALLMEFRPRSFCLNVTPERRDRYEFLATHFLAHEPGEFQAFEVPLDDFHRACLEAMQAAPGGVPGVPAREADEAQFEPA
jgi:tetratricopeptide (TPR) repeat protein